MALSRGLSIIFSQSDVSNEIFKVCAKNGSHRSFVHWWRPSPLTRLPEVPEIFRQDPFRLRQMLFYYDTTHGSPAKFAFDEAVRARSDILIIENPDVQYYGALAALMAVLKAYSADSARTVVLVLPDETEKRKIASLYADELFSGNEDGTLNVLAKAIVT